MGHKSKLHDVPKEARFHSISHKYPHNIKKSQLAKTFITDK
jgi:hypothetical protein